MEPQEGDGGTNKEEDIWSESWEKKTIFKLTGLRDFRTAPDSLGMFAVSIMAASSAPQRPGSPGGPRR